MHLQSMQTERPWTLRHPRFGWFELMLEDESQSRYWKEHFQMRKDTFLWLVNLVSRQFQGGTRGYKKPFLQLSEWQLLCGGWLEV